MKLRVGFRFRKGETIPVGILADSDRSTAFEYDPGFLGRGLSPAPFRLPVKTGMYVHDFGGRMETFGMFEDSLPDGWGRRLVDQFFRRRLGRLPSVLERLSCVGSSGMGALVYEPEAEGIPLSDGFDVSELAESAMAFDDGDAEDVLPEIRRAGGSSGGARPKVMVGFNPATGKLVPEEEMLPSGYEHWLIKFNTRRDGESAGRLEYAYYRMAVQCGVEMAESRLIGTRAGDFFATRRFDRGPNGERLHLASAAGLLHADFRVPGDEYSLVFRLTDALTRDYSQKLELFRRAALNVLAHNRDDHLKNFGFIMDERGRWRLSPFYDFTRSEGPNGWQTLSVAGEGANPGVADLRRLADEVSVTKADADTIIERTIEATRELEA